jgi:hypothetical protein
MVLRELGNLNTHVMDRGCGAFLKHLVRSDAEIKRMAESSLKSELALVPAVTSSPNSCDVSRRRNRGE